MTGDERIQKLVDVIHQSKLSWLITFLIQSHLPLRGIISQGIQSFDPLIRTLVGSDNTDSLNWIFESQDRMNCFLERLDAR